jgi:uncharacterized membrane protein YfcA
MQSAARELIQSELGHHYSLQLRSMESSMSQRDFFGVGVIDRLGVIASTACVIHCLLAPIILSLLAVYAHFLPSEEHTHRVLAVLVTLLGALAIVTGYQRHKKPLVLLLMGAGLTLIFVGAFAGDRFHSHWSEVSITLAGSCCMIAAHRQNHTFCRNCETCN